MTDHWQDSSPMILELEVVYNRDKWSLPNAIKLGDLVTYYTEYTNCPVCAMDFRYHKRSCPLGKPSFRVFESHKTSPAP